VHHGKNRPPMKPDLARLNCDVRFTPESGLETAVAQCQVWAKSRHTPPLQRTPMGSLLGRALNARAQRFIATTPLDTAVKCSARRALRIPYQ
jgi:hypothetical protein